MNVVMKRERRTGHDALVHYSAVAGSVYLRDAKKTIEEVAMKSEPSQARRLYLALGMLIEVENALLIAQGEI